MKKDKDIKVNVAKILKITANFVLSTLYSCISINSYPKKMNHSILEEITYPFFSGPIPFFQPFLSQKKLYAKNLKSIFFYSCKFANFVAFSQTHHLI